MSLLLWFAGRAPKRRRLLQVLAVVLDDMHKPVVLAVKRGWAVGAHIPHLLLLLLVEVAPRDFFFFPFFLLP